jgi:hypothetical protein
MNRFFRHTLSLALAFLTLVSASGGTLMSVGSEISLFARAKASSVPLNNQELVHQYRLGLNIDLATDQDGNSGRRLFWYVGSQLKGKEISIYRKESEWQEFDYETNSNPEELVFKGLADEGEFLDTAGSSGDYRYKVVGPEGATAYTSSDSYWPQVEGVISDSEGKPLQAVRLEAKAIDPDDNQIINLGTSYTNSQGEYALSSFYHNSSNYTLEVFIVPFKQGYDFTASTKLFTGSSAEYYSYYDPTPASSLGVNEEQLITIMIDRYANYEMDNYQSVYQLNVQAERNSEELDPEDLVESEEEEEEDELITGNLQGYTAVPNSNPLASDEDGNITAGVIPQTNAPLVGSLANDRDRDGIIDSEDDEVVEIEIDPCDYDNDGIINEDDNDLDNDGILNRYDPDIDGDGYTNREEALGLGGDGDIDGDNFCLYLRQREKERIAYLNSSKLELSGLRTAPPK